MKLELAHVRSLARLPAAPGAYLFRDLAGAPLYVGKAKDLRQRLASYLRPGGDIPPKTALMLGKAHTLELIVTTTETEALLLESSLIKEHRPRYNVLLRDDKAYPFVRLDLRETFPRLAVVRRRERDGALYFGPYPSAGSVRETLRFLAPIFGLRQCPGAQPPRRSRPCLKHQIGRCTAPCVGLISPEAYRERVRQVRLFLEGHTGPLLKEVRRAMEEEAAALRFEQAAVLRDRSRAIENVLERQIVVAEQEASWDVMHVARDEGGERAAVAVLRVRDGAVQGEEVYHLKGAGGVPDGEVLSLVIRRLYGEGGGFPREVVLPVPLVDASVLTDWASEVAGHRVLLSTPRRGLRRRLLAMALENARQALIGAGGAREEWAKLAGLLAERLGLKRAPVTVEAVDVSTTGGELAVGSLVAFHAGQPEKKAYRHYHIRGVRGVDDYAMIEEVVSRRLAGSEGGEGPPDLMLIDGGRGQLGRAMEAVAASGLSGKVEIVSLAKEGNDEGEKIYLPGRPEALRPPRHDPVLRFLQRVRDESHRFGIRFHRKRRDRKRLRSSLTEIPGVGPGRGQALLRHFGSLARVRQATEAEIAAVRGISRRLARLIHGHLRKGSHTVRS